MNKPKGMAAYIAVTAAYWAFMLSDGALRMLVLLHFHTLGFSPLQLAYLFILYEIAGANYCIDRAAATVIRLDNLGLGRPCHVCARLIRSCQRSIQDECQVRGEASGAQV